MPSFNYIFLPFLLAVIIKNTIFIFNHYIIKLKLNYVRYHLQSKGESYQLTQKHGKKVNKFSLNFEQNPPLFYIVVASPENSEYTKTRQKYSLFIKKKHSNSCN